MRLNYLGPQGQAFSATIVGQMEQLIDDIGLKVTADILDEIAPLAELGLLFPSGPL